MLHVLSFGCGAALAWLYLEWRKLEEMNDNDDWWNREFDVMITTIDNAERIAELEAENADLRRDIEIKRKKLEDLGA